MAKRLAAVQSCYIPWKGYFDLIQAVDEFVLLDDVQYTRADWRNRNRIKSPDGGRWLTIPVATRGTSRAAICEIRVRDQGWATPHWRSIEACYARSPHFRHYRDPLEALYRTATHSRLSDVNRHFLEALCRWLEIGTPLSWSMDYQLPAGRTERLVALCRKAGATTYVSGPSARSYLDEAAFRAHGIEVVFFDYAGYREYPQRFPPFDHHVSVIDLLLNVGPDARRYLLTS